MRIKILSSLIAFVALSFGSAIRAGEMSFIEVNRAIAKRVLEYGFKVDFPHLVMQTSESPVVRNPPRMMSHVAGFELIRMWGRRIPDAASFLLPLLGDEFYRIAAIRVMPSEVLRDPNFQLFFVALNSSPFSLMKLEPGSVRQLVNAGNTIEQKRAILGIVIDLVREASTKYGYFTINAQGRSQFHFGSSFDLLLDLKADFVQLVDELSSWVTEFGLDRDSHPMVALPFSTEFLETYRSFVRNPFAASRTLHALHDLQQLAKVLRDTSEQKAPAPHIQTRQDNPQPAAKNDLGEPVSLEKVDGILSQERGDSHRLSDESAATLVRYVRQRAKAGTGFPGRFVDVIYTLFNFDADHQKPVLSPIFAELISNLFVAVERHPNHLDLKIALAETVELAFDSTHAGFSSTALREIANILVAAHRRSSRNIASVFELVFDGTRYLVGDPKMFSFDESIEDAQIGLDRFETFFQATVRYQRNLPASLSGLIFWGFAHAMFQGAEYSRAAWRETHASEFRDAERFYVEKVLEAIEIVQVEATPLESYEHPINVGYLQIELADLRTRLENTVDEPPFLYAEYRKLSGLDAYTP